MKHTKKRLSPRKLPTQGRSQETVSYILEATARILGRDGILMLSTNRVAREAGVSIGSLYQYFPGKEALLSALVEKRLQEDREYFEKTLVGFDTWSLEKKVIELISAGIILHRRDRKILKVMFDQLTASGQLELAKQTNQILYQMLLSFIPATKDRELRAHIYMMTILGVWHAQAEKEWQVLDPVALGRATSQMILADMHQT